mmetsp:Transcript_15535/g.48845  ORF Transcript_15535/g.48845 Transcript_15535/m.48845 type:complete len:151 (-) Transcript_15535:16-468(-)|eukprot:CAMPEP_0182866442 /NCGR_PEP_ID=MMETSP0034_2-20130328/8207_1 /TAXON_ID=156128 /ORGANISM="Nephroselmis pyriformis, Strain CCMP717" /LENGTH=150 /DNA_ID=CAMNT_0024998769 /DNA_START=68 /DNA_END=520 /DNA_ORIENTATION=-
MATVKQQILFEDTFTVVDKDPDGKKFDRVSRLRCRSEVFDIDLLLDVNIDIYPLDVNDSFAMALASTLKLDGTPDAGYYDEAMQSGAPSLMDKYEYVMYGKLFKYQDAGGALKVEVYVSFGGLLMQLTGDAKQLESLEIDSRLYLLMRKV